MRKGVVLVLAMTVFAAVAPAAQASFHLIQVREVYAGSSTDLESEFIELQMYAPGQDQVQQADVLICNAGACPIVTVDLPNPVSFGDNQRTVLLASPGAEAEFGVTADFALPDLNSIAPENGAVCWGDLDCVEWGAVGAGGTPPSPTGALAPEIAPGQSLTRSIAAGCSTLLEASDDADDSAADFALAAPSPRPNSVTPTEQACGGGGDDNNPPETTITKHPAKKSKRPTAKFKFDSNENGSSFECKLDKKPFKSCASPRKYKHLKRGKHKFQVAATDQAGNEDKTPAKYGFKVVS